MTGVILLSIVVVGVAMLAMAVGALVSRNRCLRGSCGGLQAGALEIRGVTCDTCPSRQTRTDGIDGRRPGSDDTPAVRHERVGPSMNRQSALRVTRQRRAHHDIQ